MAYVQIARDSFARFDLVRRKACDCGSCDYCGREGRLWQYAIDRDDAWRRAADPIRGEFCGIGCMRAYHE